MRRSSLWVINLMVWHEQRVAERGEYVGPVEWEKFKCFFLDWFFLLELREAKIHEFINLR